MNRQKSGVWASMSVMRSIATSSGTGNRLGAYRRGTRMTVLPPARRRSIAELLESGANIVGLEEGIPTGTGVHRPAEDSAVSPSTSVLRLLVHAVGSLHRDHLRPLRRRRARAHPDPERDPDRAGGPHIWGHGGARMTRIALAQLGLLVAFERLAHACPFCGGKGASGLLENLLLVAAFWCGARALMRAAKRRR